MHARFPTLTYRGCLVACWKDISVFKGGLPASDALQAVAEDGITSGFEVKEQRPLSVHGFHLAWGTMF